MTNKIKKIPIGARHEWFIGALLLSVGLLILDASYSRGMFHVSFNSCPGMFEVNSTPRPTPITSVVQAQPNFHIVSPGVWRSAQVNAGSLMRMKTYGLKTIVNLQMDGEVKPWEDALAKKQGIQYFHFPVSVKEVVPAKTVDAVLSILSDPARQPVLVHCTDGKDRTGMIIAAYQLAKGSMPFRDIYQEMRMYGYEETRYPEMLKTLAIWSAARGRPEMAQEIALAGQKISEQKKQASVQASLKK